IAKRVAISRRPGRWRRLAGGLLGACALAVPLALVGAVSAAAGDTPAGFWYGTDSTTVTIPGSAPYRVPVIGGDYGGGAGGGGRPGGAAARPQARGRVPRPPRRAPKTQQPAPHTPPAARA